MKASYQLSFPQLNNELVENILKQLLNQFSIIQMFFAKGQAATVSYLIIRVEKNVDAIVLQGHKWVKKIKEQFNIVVFFSCSSKLHHQYFLASLYIEYNCRTSSRIYQKEKVENLLVIRRNWKKYKKKFNV